MTNFQNMQTQVSKIKTRNGKIKFSELLDAIEDLPEDTLAATLHYFQTKDIGRRTKYLAQMKKGMPEQLFKLLKSRDILWDVPFPPNKKPTFTFIDLFAGIGGMRLAFQNLGGACLFSSDCFALNCKANAATRIIDITSVVPVNPRFNFVLR